MMKNLLLLALFAFFFVSAAHPQKTVEPASETFQLGSRTVKIPAPEGFTEVSSRFDRVAARLIATEDPANDTLTSHVSNSMIPKLETTQDRDLEFYTKVSVSKRARTVDLTPAMFGSVVSAFEKNMDTYLDPNGSLLKRVEGNTGKSLSDLWGKDVNVQLNQPKHLGFFDKGENVLSSMMFVNVALNDKKYSIISTTSLLNINQRLVFVYAYKMNPAETDVEMLRTFTKNWTAAILAANKISSRP